MWIYVVKCHYYREGFSIVSIYSDEENAKIDVDILNDWLEQYNNCNYKNPRRKEIVNRIERMGGTEYCDSYSYSKYEVK